MQPVILKNKETKKPKKEKKYVKNRFMDVFMDLYEKTVYMSSKPTKEQKDQAHEELRSKHKPTDVVWYLILCLNLSVIPRVKHSCKLSYVSSTF